MSTVNPDMLAAIFKRQRDLQTKAYGADPATLYGDQRADYFRTMSFALADEIHEAADELGWKPWASSRHLNREAYVGELVDALHFWVNLCLLADATADEVFLAYLAKSQKNLQRQLDGYDGVAGKCPICHRALDDAAVTCTANICNAAFERSLPQPRPAVD